jgi:cytochrome c-type biogenesis protein CcmH
MILWIILTTMTAVAAVLVSAPFIRRHERRRSESADVAVYRDQLKEVENELAQGQIEPGQAESARTEIKRRLLTADGNDDLQAPPLTSGERTVAAIGVAAVVVVGSVALFGLTANFDAPVAPFAASAPFASERTTAASSEKPTSETIALAEPTTRPESPTTGSSKTPGRGSLPPVEEMIQRLVTRLQKNPKDTEGWRTLGWSYFSMDHFTESAVAYGRAIELNPKVAAYHSARAEALVKAENGAMTEDAKADVAEALKLDPKDPRARYLDGLAKQQAGDKAGALKEWTEVLGSLEPSDSWSADLKQRIDELTHPSDGSASEETAPPNIKIGSESSKSGEAPPPSEAPSPKVEEVAPVVSLDDKGPRPDDIRRAEAMAPSDRAAMIRNMVDSLASRLEASPHDADGWIKLIRSRTVLGETGKANQALERALKVFENEATERERISAAAQQLGLSP